MPSTLISPKPFFRRIRNIIMLLPVVLITACDQYPRDPQDSLHQIEQSGELHVGVIASPPWVTGTAPDTPSGIEVRLMERFARALDVDVVWHWGNADMLFEGLKHYELDILIGGITASNPWKQHVGFTVPYFSGHAVIGVPQEHAALSSLEGVTVATRQGEGLSKKIKSKGGRVQLVEDLAGANMPVAARAWEIEALGMKNTGIKLQQFQHVVAVPKGENALLMRLEEFLLMNSDQQITTRLIVREAER